MQGNIKGFVSNGSLKMPSSERTSEVSLAEYNCNAVGENRRFQRSCECLCIGAGLDRGHQKREEQGCCKSTIRAIDQAHTSSSCPQTSCSCSCKGTRPQDPKSTEGEAAFPLAALLEQAQLCYFLLSTSCCSPPCKICKDEPSFPALALSLCLALHKQGSFLRLNADALMQAEIAKVAPPQIPRPVKPPVKERATAHPILPPRPAQMPVSRQKECAERPQRHPAQVPMSKPPAVQTPAQKPMTHRQKRADGPQPQPASVQMETAAAVQNPTRVPTIQPEKRTDRPQPPPARVRVENTPPVQPPVPRPVSQQEELAERPQAPAAHTLTELTLAVHTPAPVPVTRQERQEARPPPAREEPQPLGPGPWFLWDTQGTGSLYPTTESRAARRCRERAQAKREKRGRQSTGERVALPEERPPTLVSRL